MLRRLQFALVFAAGLAATGSQWDVVQTFAWGRMIYQAAQTMPVADAVRVTFQPASSCNLCRLVNDVKQKQQASSVPEEKLPGKILLFCPPAPRELVAVATAPSWSPSEQTRMTVGRAAPPVRPPRGFAV